MDSQHCILAIWLPLIICLTRLYCIGNWHKPIARRSCSAAHSIPTIQFPSMGYGEQPHCCSRFPSFLTSRNGREWFLVSRTALSKYFSRFNETFALVQKWPFLSFCALGKCCRLMCIQCTLLQGHDYSPMLFVYGNGEIQFATKLDIPSEQKSTNVNTAMQKFRNFDRNAAAEAVNVRLNTLHQNAITWVLAH